MLPEALAEEHPAAGVDQPAECVQRIDSVLRRLGHAERVASADAQDQVRRPVNGSGRGLLDERDPAGGPRATALSRPRARSTPLRSIPVPTAPGTAARMRSISSPQPQPRSSTVAGRVPASRPTRRAALASDNGPWKVRRVKRGGRSSSVIAVTLGPLGHPDKFIISSAQGRGRVPHPWTRAPIPGGARTHLPPVPGSPAQALIGQALGKVGAQRLNPVASRDCGDPPAIRHS